MKPVIIIPTYIEKDNIQELIPGIRAAVNHPLDILVVDSASPDGTANAVREIQKKDKAVYLLEQKAKLGLGRAYLDGMQWVLERDYDCVFTMDADFSHHPKYLNGFLDAIQSHDLVIGSRYVPGGGPENWPLLRRLLSRFANGYAKALTGLPFEDLTSGFHCFRAPLLKKILRYRIHTEGYAFLIELKFLAILQGASFHEIPIIFGGRTKGDSKISKRVMFESMLFVLTRSFQRGRIKKNLPKNKRETQTKAFAAKGLS